jgi:NDP-sugar pyrophosphorylase family protein
VGDGELGSLAVVILAGGLGTRLRSVLPERPKCLAPVGAHSFLEVQIDLLRRQGARRFVLCVGHQAGQVRQAFGDGREWDIRIDYSEETERLLGTGGALKQAEGFITPRALVLNGDTFFALDYAGFVRFHLGQRPAPVASLALARVSDASRYGEVVLDGAGASVVEFQEKRPRSAARPAWVNGGAYVVERELLASIPAGERCSLENDGFPRALAAGRRLAALTSGTPFYDIGTPEALEAFRDRYASVRTEC